MPEPRAKCGHPDWADGYCAEMICSNYYSKRAVPEKPAVEEPPVRRMLDLSTSHLPARLGVDGLANEPSVQAHELPNGWLMWVPCDPDEHAERVPEDEPVPAHVLAIQRYARAHDCDWVLFDADGSTVAELPTWDW